MTLQEIRPRWELDSTPLPPEIDAWITSSRREIEEFWDRSRKTKKTIFVECDFSHLAETLVQCMQRKWLRGERFVEWGCGFGVVTGIAALLGLSAVGIEAEPFLLDAAERLHRRAGLKTELWHGNFLPAGAAELALAEDPHVSLTIQMDSVYQAFGESLESFGTVFCYAYPGEEHFLKHVFKRFAASNSILILYRGPYQIELYRKAT